MRSLAIAKLRLLTRIRTASVVFALSTIPALMVSIIASWEPENAFRAAMPFHAEWLVRAGIFAWILHVAVLLIGSETSGQMHPQREGAEWSDLMETIPVGAGGRFLGEALGSLGVNLTIHLCAMPVLALVATLSPLPLAVFAILEVAALVLLFLAAGAAAWKRCARPTKWSGTRMARSGLLFWVLLVLILQQTSQWETFVRSLGDLLTLPVYGSWKRVASAIEQPVQLAVLVVLLCLSYMTFYYVSSVRGLARRRGV